jgi:PKD repeat protein
VLALVALALLTSVAVGDASTRPAFDAPATFAAGTQPWDVVAADVNGDGKIDAIVPNLHSDTVSVFLGDGTGGFAAAQDFSTASNPGAVVVADFNGDGHPDVAVDEAGAQQVSIYLGDGTGAFAQSASSIQSTHAQDMLNPGIAAGDLNGDGNPDLVVSAGGSAGGYVSVYLGDGSGGLTADGLVAAGFDSQLLALGDLNGDGRLDLAAADDGDGAVAVLLGNGDGTFGTAAHYSVGSSPSDVAIGDLNEDGAPDLVVTNFGSGNLSVLLGNGDGTFQAQTQTSAGASPESVALADVDGDGHLDAITANGGDSDVSVLEGDGSGQLGVPYAVSSGTTPISVTTADLNGDAKPDLLVADSTDDTLSSFLNATAASAPSSLTVTRFDDPSGSGSCPADCSLRQAVAAVADGGTVTLPAGAYVLTQGQLVLDRTVQIEGAGAATTSISHSSVAAPDRVLEVTGTAVVNGVTIEHGDTDVGAGAQVEAGGDLTLEQSVVSGNTASTRGGGIENAGTLTIDRSQILDNTASGISPGVGGGIDNAGATLAITNTTISGNHAAGPGGGLDDSAAASLANVTVSANRGGFPGGGGIASAGRTTLLNTLLEGNALQSGTSSNCSGTLVSAGHNLSDDTSCSLSAAGDLDDVSAFQGVDAGDDAHCPAVDQDGTPRPVGPHCDIGALETTVAGPGPVDTGRSTVGVSPSSAPADGSSTAAVTVTLRDANGTAVPGIDVNLAANNGHSSIGVANVTTNAAGVATFTVTDTTVESVVYSATDRTDSLALLPNVTVDFTATGGGANAAPTASFSVSANNLAVSVDASASSDSDGTIASYAWDFGDGTTGSGVTASHTYGAGGTYTITLTVTDDGGASSAATRAATVAAPSSGGSGGGSVLPPVAATIAPSPDFTYAPSLPSAGDTVTFTPVSIVGPAGGYTRAWDFGDGTTGSGFSPTHTFPPGIFTVTCRVRDDGGTVVSKASLDVLVGAFPLPAGRDVEGLVTVLRPYGPGEPDPSGPAPAGLPISLYAAGSSSGQFTPVTSQTASGGIYRFATVTYTPTSQHPMIEVRAAAGTLGAYGFSEAGPLAAALPSITDLPLTISPHPHGLILDGTVTTADGTRTPTKATRITVTAEPLGDPNAARTVESHSLGHYRIELPNAADVSAVGNGGAVQHPTIVITLEENGRLVDQTRVATVNGFRPGIPVAVPPLHSVWPLAAGSGRVVTGLVTVLRPFGPGEADPSGPAPAGMPITLYLAPGYTGGQFVPRSGQTASGGVYRFTDVTYSPTSQHPTVRIIAAAGTLGAYGFSDSGPLAAAAPSITDLPLTVAPHQHGLILEGTVTAADGSDAPPASTRITITAEPVGDPGAAATVESHSLGDYRIELPDAAARTVISTATGSPSHPNVLVTLKENGQLVDQARIAPFSSFKPGDPVQVPALHGAWPIPVRSGRVVTGLVTVLRPFGPGEADPSGPAAAGLPITLYPARGSTPGQFHPPTVLTGADGSYRFTNVTYTPDSRHSTIAVRAAAGNLGVYGASDAGPLPAAPSITDLPFVVAPDPRGLILEGTVTTAGGTPSPPPTTRITVTAEPVGDPNRAVTVESHSLGTYRIELPNDADGTVNSPVNSPTTGVTHAAVIITLSENGRVVDQVQVTSTGRFAAGTPVAVPPLTAVASVPPEK